MQAGAHASSRRMVSVGNGDMLLHSFDMMHGVDVDSGEVYVCPHTPIYVSSCSYIFVIILLLHSFDMKHGVDVESSEVYIYILSLSLSLSLSHTHTHTHTHTHMFLAF